jgi:hypothetical protein
VLQAPHPLFETVSLNAALLQVARMGELRATFKGVRWTDAETGWTYKSLTCSHFPASLRRISSHFDARLHIQTMWRPANVSSGCVYE